MVVGGSYVGLEFAHMYRRFGSEVTVVEMGPRLIHREDLDVSAAISEILRHEGINIRVDAPRETFDQRILRERDQGFESLSLQRRVGRTPAARRSHQRTGLALLVPFP